MCLLNILHRQILGLCKNCTIGQLLICFRTRSLPRRRSCSWPSSSTWRRRWSASGSATAGRRRSASTPPAAPPLPCRARPPHPSWRTKPPATAPTWCATSPACSSFGRLWFFDLLISLPPSVPPPRYRATVSPRSPPASAQQVSCTCCSHPRSISSINNWRSAAAIFKPVPLVTRLQEDWTHFWRRLERGWCFCVVAGTKASSRLLPNWFLREIEA